MPDYTTKSTAAVSVSAATAKSVLSIITPATRRARIKRITIGGLSVTASDVPGTVEIVQFDTDGTGTAVTPTALDPAEPASLVTSKANYSAEPTTNVVVRSVFPLSPQGVTAEKAFGPGEELVIPVSKTATVRVTFPQAQSCWPEIEFAE
jgi:NaMN:DMB phosphoribosyltransferase